MNHHTTDDFWECYKDLPETVRRVADRNYAKLREDPRHPSLQRVGRLWSVRVGSGHRALAADGPDGLVWFWIGPHDEYKRIIAIF